MPEDSTPTYIEAQLHARACTLSGGSRPYRPGVGVNSRVPQGSSVPLPNCLFWRPSHERPHRRHLPLDSAKTSTVVPAAAAPAQMPLPAGQFGDPVDDLQQAWRVVESLHCQDHDVAAQMQATFVCSGSSPVEALEAVTATVRRAPQLEIHSIAWARTFGPGQESWQYQATVLVSLPDRYGDTPGLTHLGVRRA
ncbi:hypothetical protein GXW82_21915 [Streptacidiphilus sp. 4-A2]|nr:hypothetical protein [Streptacidiphilus sp. 4-A2]